MKVSDIIGHLRNADQVSIIVGAGASKSAGIPLANELVHTINSDFDHCLSNLSKYDRKDYGKVMGALSPQDRKKLIQPLLQNARINWGHIALACLIKSDKVNVERVLTFNFDQVLERAASLMGMHLPVYDFGVSPTDDINYLASPAIVHLHGQSYGLRMMNSGDETEEHKDKLEALLADSLRNHVVLVIGYSGEADPAFKTMTKVFNSNNHLIWCGHSPKPGKHLSDLLARKYAHYIGDCDFDITMLELAKGLGCFPPDIFVNPPRHLLEELEDVTEWPDDGTDGEGIDILTSTREQLKTSEADWTLDDAGRAQMDILKGDEGTPGGGIDLEASKLVARAWAQVSKGNALLEEARALSGKAQTEAIKLAYEKYAKAVEIKPDMHEAFNNWGNALLDEARTLSGKAQTEAFKLAYEKYAKAVEIKPDKHEAFNNWGTALSDEAKTLSGKAQTEAFKLAYEKYAKAIEIKPDMHEAFNNWGTVLLDEARTLSGKAQTEALKLAYEKFAKAVEVKPDKHQAFNNWGTALSDEAKTLSGKAQTEAFKQAYEKYAKAIEIKPDKHQAFNNWGGALSDEARTLSGKAQTEAFKQARHKLEEAKSLRGHPIFNLACLEAVTGNIETALDELKACYEAGTLPDAAHLDADTDLDVLRDHPRYKALRDQLS